MYKKIILILIFFLNIAIVNAELTINFSRPYYIPGETVQVSLDFQYDPLNDITISDISIKDYQGRKIPVGLFLIKLTDKNYYVYFDLSNFKIGNYSFIVDNYYYIANEKLFKLTSSTSFEVKNLTRAIVALDPGVAVLNLNERNYLNFKIKNNGNINVNVSLISTKGIISTPNFTLYNNSIRNIGVTFPEDITAGTEKLTLNYGNLSYDVQMLLVKEEIKPIIKENITGIIPKDAIKFIEPISMINLTLENNETVEGSLRFKNFYSRGLHDLNFKLTNNLEDVIRINLSYLPVLETNEIETQYLWVNEDMDLKRNYLGELVLTSREGTFISFPIYINYKERIENVTVTNITKVNITANESINKTLIGKEKAKRRWWPILIILLIIIAAIVVYFKTRPKKKSEFEEFIGKLKEKY